MRKSPALAQVLLYAMVAVSSPHGVLQTGGQDVLPGLDNPTQGQWQQWYDGMRESRDSLLAQAGFDPTLYQDPATSWGSGLFRQYFLFMYDRAFYHDGQYQTLPLLDQLIARYGRIDSFLLWHAYPQLGFDSRSQFDYYRQMPGGLARLRTDVINPLHARGVRVFLDFNPWSGSDSAQNAQEMADVVASLDADGVMLDTLFDVPADLKSAVAAKKSGVIFAPEGRPADASLSAIQQSWAQWYDLGSPTDPSILRIKWLVPQHQTFLIRRWDTDRSRDIAYSFFNGAGMLIWDNVFGTWNPYSQSDRQLLAETGALIDSYSDLFSKGEWTPLIPTGVAGLDANHWVLGGRELFTLLNRTDRALEFKIPARATGSFRFFSFWPPSQGLNSSGSISVGPHSVQALVYDQPQSAQAAVAHFIQRSALARSIPDQERTPPPLLQKQGPLQPGPGRDLMVAVPGGSYVMSITHQKRESGCYPQGAEPGASWGWYYTDLITHKIGVDLEPFKIKQTPVTNAEFLRFVSESGYAPKSASRFLQQIPRDASGALPKDLGDPLASLPVTFVSLDDARAYARWSGTALPTEAQWQWAAQNTHLSTRWPWGNDSSTDDSSCFNLSGALESAYSHLECTTQQGVLNLTGQAWEWTESEWTDGHNRFSMLRGGVYLPADPTPWVIPRGARPNDFHAKYFLMDEGLDRSEAVSFRTVSSGTP